MDHNHGPEGTNTFVRGVEEQDDGEVSDDEDSVEIERKFLVPTDRPEFFERLKRHGARLIVEEAFADEYFDRDDYVLSLNDTWLRSRQGKWELKYGESDGLDVPTNGTDPLRRTIYREQHNPEEILKTLHSRGFLNGAMDGDDLSLIMNSVPFRKFAQYTTTRKVFAVPGNDLLHPAKICVDDTDFGHCVGEIEVSVDNNENIPSALRTIAALSENLGLKPLHSAPVI